MKWKEEAWSEGRVDTEGEGKEEISDIPWGWMIILCASVCACVRTSVQVASQNLGVIPSAFFSYMLKYFLGLGQAFPSSAEEAVYRTLLEILPSILQQYSYLLFAGSVYRSNFLSQTHTHTYFHFWLCRDLSHLLCPRLGPERKGNWDFWVYA